MTNASNVLDVIEEPVAADDAPAQGITAASPPRTDEPRMLPAPSRRHVGALDVATWDVCWGWAWDPARPEESVDIEVRIEGRTLMTLAADIYRPDLVAAGMGGGRHGFHFQLPPSLFSNAVLVMEILVAGTASHVLGSPALVGDSTRHSPQTVQQATIERATEQLLLSAGTAREARALSIMLLRQFDRVQHHLARLEDAGTRARESLASLGGLGGAMREALAALLDHYPVLFVPPCRTPGISIIVPVRDHFSLTYRCVETILEQGLDQGLDQGLECGDSAGVELVLVDDGSVDETRFAGLVLQGEVTIVRLERSEGFVGAVTAGAARARGRLLLLLNNDTELHAGALAELAGTFKIDPTIGIVGAKLLDRAARIQEVGGIVWRLGDAWNWGRGGDPQAPGFMHMRDVDYVSGAALMIDRLLYEAVGGLSPEFAPGYYEDTDLCFKVRAAGRRVVVQPQAVVTHHEGASAGTDTAGSGMKRFQAVNHRVFLRKWRDTLATHRRTGEAPALESDRSVRLRALFIDDRIPTPDQDAGSVASVEHMRSLQRLGYKVTLVGADMRRIAPYTADLERIGIECLCAPYFHSVEQALRQSQADYGLVYLYRLGNASAYLPLVRHLFPDARVIYSVSDLHWLRTEREHGLGLGRAGPREIEALCRLEVGTLAACDQIITHSSHEAALLTDMLPDASISVIAWPVRRAAEIPLFHDRTGIAFVGGFNHPPNIDAAEWLAGSIMPLVWRKAPTLTLSLIGSNPSGAVRRLAGSRIVVTGQVPDLERVLSRTRVMVASLRYGAGVKGKVLASFAAGIPCVMTSCAAEGLDLPEPLASIVADTPQAIADCVLRLLDDEEWSLSLSQAGFAYIDERLSAAHIDRLMADAAGLGRAPGFDAPGMNA